MQSTDLTSFKTLDIFTIYHLNEDELIEYFKSISLFFNGICETCQIQMSQWHNKEKNYSLQIRSCSSCGFKCSDRHGTIFEGMRISFLNFNTILYYYAYGFTNENIYDPLRSLTQNPNSLPTIRYYTKLFRYMIHLFIQEYLDNTILPGLVEIDEACIYKIRRGRHGRLAHIVFWVFGLKCRSSKKVVIYPVLNRTRAQLFALIQKHVLPGTKIYSDRFSCHWNNRRDPPESHLVRLGYLHEGINHSREFVDALDSSIHTNTIERAWRSLKLKFRNYKPRKYIKELISEFIFESLVKKENRYYFILYLLNKYHNDV